MGPVIVGSSDVKSFICSTVLAVSCLLEDIQRSGRQLTGPDVELCTVVQPRLEAVCGCTDVGCSVDDPKNLRLLGGDGKDVEIIADHAVVHLLHSLAIRVSIR